MSDPCARWVELADRAAAGEVLEGGDTEFLRVHTERCSECGAERELWAKLPGVLEEPSLLFAPLRDEPVPEPEVRPARTRRARTGRPWLALAGVVVAASLALGVVVWKLRAPALVASSSAAVRLAFVTGDVQVNRAPARAGRKLERGDRVKLGGGDACVLFEPGVTVCARRESEFVVERTELQRRRLRLLSGGVLARLAPQPQGATFGVETEGGAFIAKGTSFAVEIASGGVAELRVHQGTVSAEPRSGSSQAVRAPASASLGMATPVSRPLSSAAASRDARLLRLTSFWSEQASCELEVSVVPGGQVALDGMELGPSPLTALVMHGDHRLALSLPGFGPVVEHLTLVRGERVARNYELTPLAVAEPSGEPVSTPREAATDAAPARPTPIGAGELLARAREQRVAARYADAAATYRRLLALYPRSAQARAALVSLGELELSQLGNAEAALGSFDAYLRSGGALAQEARYGRVRALRRLGRFAEERSAIEAFLRDYPRSVQAAALRSRLSER